MFERIMGKDGEETDYKVSMYVSQRDLLIGRRLDTGTQLTIFSFHFLFTRSPFFQLQVSHQSTYYFIYSLFTLHYIYFILYLYYSLLY